MEATTNTATARLGGYTAIVGAVTMVIGAVLWGISGADLALATGDIEGYLAAGGGGPADGPRHAHRRQRPHDVRLPGRSRGRGVDDCSRHRAASVGPRRRRPGSRSLKKGDVFIRRQDPG